MKDAKHMIAILAKTNMRNYGDFIFVFDEFLTLYWKDTFKA